MLKWRHLIEHNNKYLLTSEAVVKEHVLTTTGMWVPVQDEETPANCKGLQICDAHKRKRCVHTERNPKRQCQRKCEETKFIHKQMMSENKVTSDNFDNVEFHVHSHD